MYGSRRGGAPPPIALWGAGLTSRWPSPELMFPFISGLCARTGSGVQSENAALRSRGSDARVCWRHYTFSLES